MNECTVIALIFSNLFLAQTQISRNVSRFKTRIDGESSKRCIRVSNLETL